MLKSNLVYIREKVIGMVSNRRKTDLEGADFYPTPAWGTKALIKYEKFVGDILEPCCGNGAMAEILKLTGCNIIASDLYSRDYGSQCNFFDIKNEYDNVITNPPYNIAGDILDHALSISKNKVCILVRTAFLESITRYNRFYSTRPPSRVYTFVERLSLYPAGEEIKGGGTTSYSWLVWDKNNNNGITELKWIEPGLKKQG